MIHRDDAAGHGRHEQRLVQVVTVDGLLFPPCPPGPAHPAQTPPVRGEEVVQRDVYAIIDLPSEQADAAEIAAWARGHWTVEVRHEALRFRTGVRDPRRPVVAAAG